MTGEPGILQSMASQRVRHNWATNIVCVRTCVCVCVHVCVWFFSSLFQKDWSSPLNFKGIFYCIDFVRKYTPSTYCCSVTKSCPTLCNPMDCSMPGSPVLHHLLEFAIAYVHWVSDTIQPSHPLLPSSPFTFNLSQHQGLFQWVGSSHQVAIVWQQ